MRISRNVRRIVALTLSASAGGLIGAAPGEAFPSEGFHLYNNSTAALRVWHGGGNSIFDGRPADGAVLKPGVGDQDWEVIYDSAHNTYNEAWYKIEGGDGGYLILRLQVSKRREATSSCEVTTTTYQPNPSFRCTGGGKSISFHNPPGTKFDIGPQRREEQAQVLKEFCTRQNRTTCQFGSIKYERTRGQEHQVSSLIKNTIGVELEASLHGSDAVTAHNSVGLEMSKNGDNRAVRVALDLLERNSGQPLVDRVALTTTLLVKVRPHMEAWITDQPPIIRVTGEFKLTLAHTTWILPDVSFVFPDQTRGGLWAIRERPLAPP